MNETVRIGLIAIVAVIVAKILASKIPAAAPLAQYL